jgi:diadenosine tetraphosphate (Ap4A) HIT family hydrolase
MTCIFCDKLQHLDDLPADELVAPFEHSYALLGQFQYYTGYCVLASRLHAGELHELPDDARHGFLNDMNRLSRAITAAFRPRKLNCELLGNQVAHPHWHIIPRYESDPEHLKPAWLAIDRAERDSAERTRLLGPSDRLAIASRIRKELFASCSPLPGVWESGRK